MRRYKEVLRRHYGVIDRTHGRFKAGMEADVKGMIRSLRFGGLPVVPV
jgi:hypothetical protein